MARKSVRILKRILIVFLSIIALFIIVGFFYMRQDKFGLNKQSNIPLVTPIIGELVNLKDTSQVFSQWWVGV
jgi:type II secretory pathway component PulF